MRAALTPLCAPGERIKNTLSGEGPQGSPSPTPVPTQTPQEPHPGTPETATSPGPAGMSAAPCRTTGKPIKGLGSGEVVTQTPRGILSVRPSGCRSVGCRSGCCHLLPPGVQVPFRGVTAPSEPPLGAFWGACSRWAERFCASRRGEEAAARSWREGGGRKPSLLVYPVPPQDGKQRLIVIRAGKTGRQGRALLGCCCSRLLCLSCTAGPGHFRFCQAGFGIPGSQVLLSKFV